MRLWYIIGVCLSCYCVLSESASLPSTWGRCSKSSKDFKSCLRKNVEFAIHSMKDPVPQLGMKSLDPLEIPAMYIGQGTGPVNAAQDFKNVKLRGLTTSIVHETDFDLDKLQFTSYSTSPFLILEAEYDLKGKLLLLPVYGHGPCNITLTNMKIHHTIDFEKFEKKGKTYFKPINYKVVMDPERLTYQFDNLFDGQEGLGENINKVLNENWDEVFSDVKSGYEKSFAAIFLSLANQVFPKVPLDDIFLE